MNAEAIAARIAAATGASAEVVASMLRQEIATDEARQHRAARRYRVAMGLLRELASAPDLSAYPTEGSVLPGFRAIWRAQQLLKAEEGAALSALD